MAENSDSCPFARVALQVATRVLRPTALASAANISSHSRNCWAVLCLMRYEDWTFREAEVASARTTSRTARSAAVAKRA